MTHISDRCRRFHELHQSGCFVMPNPWDVGSASLLASLDPQFVIDRLRAAAAPQVPA